MDTSGTGVVFLLCFLAVIAAAVQSVAPLLEGRLSVRRVRPGAWAVWLCVAVPSLLQVPFPRVYDALYRNADAVTSDHQWWRLLTAVTVQDGGVVGTVSNLVLLALALVLCSPLWGTTATVVTFWAAGVGLNLLAVAFGATDGAGNSGATLTLLASLPAYALAALPPGQRTRAVAGAVVVGVAAVALVVSGDGHGIAVALGLLLGVAGLPSVRRRGPAAGAG